MAIDTAGSSGSSLLSTLETIGQTVIVPLIVVLIAQLGIGRQVRIKALKDSEMAWLRVFQTKMMFMQTDAVEVPFRFLDTSSGERYKNAIDKFATLIQNAIAVKIQLNPVDPSHAKLIALIDQYLNPLFKIDLNRYDQNKVVLDQAFADINPTLRSIDPIREKIIRMGSLVFNLEREKMKNKRSSNIGGIRWEIDNISREN